LGFHYSPGICMSKLLGKQFQESDREPDKQASAEVNHARKGDKKMSKRLVSLDAYRGLIMICLISVGFGLSAFKGHPWLGFLADQVRHVPWEGLTFWDLIQPAFMFMVGMAMPFAYGKRRSLGLSHRRIFSHVIYRALMLIVIANVIGTIHRGEPGLSFINVLDQIAIGYFLAFFVIKRGYLGQGLTAAGLLFGYTIAWVFYPGNGPGGPWEMGFQNLGGDFDFWMLGRNYSGHYVGLNAIPATATIIFGMMAGRVVGRTRSQKRIMQILAAAGFSGLFLGLLFSPVVPIIKHIWTASFTLYSAGIIVLGLALVYWMVEVKKWTRWTYIPVVVGMNSMFAYIIFMMARGSVDNAVMAFIRPMVEAMGPWGAVLHSLLSLAVIWYVMRFFYKRGIFFKV
jgi:heparan-alpha-glucosaminide N-acetyltransferase